MFPGSQSFFRFSGADQGFRQEGADDGFLGFRKIFGVQAFLKMLAGFQGQAVFQGFQTLLVFFIFQEGLACPARGEPPEEVLPAAAGGVPPMVSRKAAQDVRTAREKRGLKKVCIIVGL